MQVTVLKDFDYAHDGVKTKRVTAGEDIPVRDPLVPGLTEAGFVGPLGSKPPKAAAAPAKGDAKPADAKPADPAAAAAGDKKPDDTTKA
jgi:hypothetical protein